MLIDFTIKNYRSIKDEVTLSFLKSTKGDSDFGIINVKSENLEVLPTCLIYGANASGKTNVIKAFSKFISLVMNSVDFKVDSKIPFEPFLLDGSSEKENTSFDIEFIKNDVRYNYYVEYNRNEIVRETLRYYPKGRPKAGASLFDRKKGRPNTYGVAFRGDKRAIERLTLPNMLFLSRLANMNNEFVKPIYDFFRDDLLFHFDMDSRMSMDLHTTKNILEDKTREYKNRVVKFLNAADIDVDDISIIKVEGNENIKSVFKMSDDLSKGAYINLFYRTVFIKKTYSKKGKHVGSKAFDLKEMESGGTYKLYDLASKILDVLDNGKVLIIDEFDSGIHPNLNHYIINLFKDPITNPKGAQLIAATHDICVMDMEGLRRDQVWFTNKDKFGATQLYSMDEFDLSKVRANINFSKWYMDGRFKAIPNIKNVKNKL